MANLFNSLGAVLVIVIAVLQFTKIFDKPWGKWLVLSLALGAAASVVAAAIFSYREDRRREKRAEERDKRFEELAGDLAAALHISPRSDATRPSGYLRDKITQMAHDLFAFLREKGPVPGVPLDDSMSLVDQIKAVMRANGPRVEGIHYGYQHRFKQRLIDLMNELAENGITDTGIQDYEVDPPQVQNADRIRAVAEKLLLLAARMDIAEQQRGHKQ